MGHFENGAYVKYDTTAQIPIQLPDGSWGIKCVSTKTTPPCTQYMAGEGLIDASDMPLDPMEKKLLELEERIKALEEKKCGCHKTSH